MISSMAYTQLASKHIAPERTEHQLTFRCTQQLHRHLTLHRKHHSTSQPQEQTGKSVSFGRGEGDLKGDLMKEPTKRNEERL